MFFDIEPSRSAFFLRARTDKQFFVLFDEHLMVLETLLLLCNVTDCRSPKVAITPSKSSESSTSSGERRPRLKVTSKFLHNLLLVI